MHEDKNHINVLEDEKLRIFFGEKPLGQSQHKVENICIIELYISQNMFLCSYPKYLQYPP
jgi:hypothetical protein